MSDIVKIFYRTGESFADALSKYIEEHPYEQVVAISEQTTGGHITCNVVVFRMVFEQ